MSKVALTEVGHLDPADAIRAFEAAGHEVVILNSRDPQHIIDRAGDCDALYVAVTKVPAEVIEALPNLKVIATSSVGFNHIDVAAAQARGVTVCNIPSVASEEVATHALAGIMMLLREIEPAVAEVRGDGWSYVNLPMPPRISELTLGLFSLGRIAQYLAERTLPLFGRVVAYDPFVPDDKWMEGVERVHSVEELLQASNVLSLHAPATPETRGIISDETLAQMPEGSYLINAARGDLVDAEALIRALDSGQLTGAFFDVADPEPPAAGDPLVHHPRVIMTPHVGFRSATSVRQYLMIPVENILAVLDGRVPPNVVPAASRETV